MVYQDQAQLRRFIQNAMDGYNLGKKLYFGAIPVDLAARIKADTGVDVEGYNCALGANEIRKIFKDHGNGQIENLRGQRAITIDDVLSLQDIIQAPDDIRLSKKQYNGKPAIEFVKTINGRTTVVSYMSDKHMDLTVQTMYSGKNKEGLATPTGEQAPVNTPVASSGTALENSIFKTDGEVNTQYSLKGAVRAYEGRALAEDSELYNYDFLTSLPDMKVTELPSVETVRDADGKINTRAVVDLGMKNARAVGTERDGKIFIRNDYTGRALRLDASSVRHGLNGGLSRLLTNARLGAVIGDVVKNAVPINALQNKAQGVDGTYAMAAYAADEAGREFVAIVTAEQRSGNIHGLEIYDVTHAVSGRQKRSERADTKSQGVYPSTNASTIKIADFLEIVKGTHQSILPQDVLNHFEEVRNPSGYYTGQAKFSLKGGLAYLEEAGRIQEQAQKAGWSDAQLREALHGAVDRMLQSHVEKYGSIPAGENPARTVQVPKRTAAGEKVSRTVRTILEAKATPEEAIPSIRELVAKGDFSYETITDRAAIARAEETVTDRSWNRTMRDWERDMNAGRVNKDNTALGWALYNHAANAGDLDAAMDVLQHMVRSQRSAAQALQATRILKKLSPEAQLYGAAQSVEGLQRELNERYGGGKAPELKIDPELGERLLAAEDQKGRDAALREIYRDIGRQLPARFRDKWNAWRYLSMLGNPRTHVRNLVGNAGFAPVVAVKDLAATGIEKAVHAVSGGRLERSKGLAGLGKLLPAAWADYANVEEAALGGGKYGDLQNANRYIEEGRRIFPGRNPVSKALEAARRANSYALDREDVWFSKPHYAFALAQFCAAHRITEAEIRKGNDQVLAAARNYAIREAQKATYRDANALSQAISALGKDHSRGRNPVGKALGTVMEGILPFRKTPANILARGLEYSPLGLLKGISYDLTQVHRGNMTGAEAIDNISAGLTGTGLLGLGVWLAAEGLVRGLGAGDDRERELERLQGHQDYALELRNGTSITLDWLAPEALPFFVGVNLWEATHGSGQKATLSQVLNAVGNVSEPMLEMSCLQSLNDVLESGSRLTSDGLGALPAALASAATSYLTQALPTLLGQIERTGEAERETTYTGKSAFLTEDIQYLLGKVSGKIPFWEYQQIPYIDAWGRHESNGSTGERALGSFINPAYTSKIEESPVEDELLRLYKETGEAGVLPSRAEKYFMVDGESRDLTAQEYVRYAEKKGQTALKLVSDLTEWDGYKNLEDGVKTECVKDAYTYANQSARHDIDRRAKEAAWVQKARTGEETHGIPVSVYILLRNEVNDMESLKDEGGDPIAYSKSLLVMQAVYSWHGLTDAQREYLFEAFEVGGKVIAYNRAAVDETLQRMRAKQEKAG